MRNKDVRIGMKVVPFQKTVNGWSNFPTHTWEECSENQGFLYVTEYDNDQKCWVLSEDTDGKGDFYNSQDFKSYGDESMENKKEEKFWIVADNNFPTRATYKHTTENMARLEAQRLAKEHQGNKFVVLEAIYAVEISALVETEYEQDLDIPF